MSQLLSDTARNRQVGIALVTVTTLMFAVLDTSAKWLVQSLPVLQVVWLRFVFHTLLTTAIFMPSMGVNLFKINNPRLQLLRGVMLALMTGLNFFALQYLQLAETGAVQFSVPILIALISAWLLHEKLDAVEPPAPSFAFERAHHLSRHVGLSAQRRGRGADRRAAHGDEAPGDSGWRPMDHRLG